MNIREFLIYKKRWKIYLSLILVVITAWLQLTITQPCRGEQNEIIFPCDYYVGFPIPFWVVTDFFAPYFFFMFCVGLALNWSIWYMILSLIFYSFKKS